jgi:photosystem II stability/assembly factor-like uncharacterized protein
MENISIIAATVGSGMFVSKDSGKNWVQSYMKIPVPPWAPWVAGRSVAVSPFNDKHFLSGTDAGVHLSEDGGSTWKFLSSQANNMQVWSTVWHPTEPDTILIGLAPFKTDRAILRSTDRGETWENLNFPLVGESGYGATHVTHIAFDPRDLNTIWASVEIGGLWVSKDNGKSWKKTQDFGPTDKGLASNIFEDIHSFAIGPEGNLYVATPRGVQVSTDDGATFTRHVFEPFPDREKMSIDRDIVSYCRGIVVKPDDPKTVFVAIGDYTPGKNGACYRSKDAGKTWHRCKLPTPPNTTLYWLAVHPKLPNTIVAVSMYGQIYISDDAGDNWRISPRTLGEIRGVAFAPN